MLSQALGASCSWIHVCNLEQSTVEQACQFGINMIMHLLKRWKGRLSAPTVL